MSQELFTKIQSNFQEIEDDLLSIEKLFFSIEPELDKVIQKIELCIVDLRNNNMFRLVKKMILLRNSLISFKSKRGYNPLLFQDMFEVIQKMLAMAPEEILGSQVVQKILNQSTKNNNKQKQYLSHNETTDVKKFLMVKYDNIGYLISIHDRIWERFVKVTPSSQHLKIKINKNQDKTYLFETITNSVLNTYESEVIRKVVLVKNEYNKLQGFIVDQVEGILYLRPKLLTEKIKYMPINQNTSKPYIQIRGNRYFIKKTKEEYNNILIGNPA